MSRIVYVTHSAELAGAELSLLRTLRHVHDVPDLDAHVLLGSSGPVADECAAMAIPFQVLPMRASLGNATRSTLSFRGAFGVVGALAAQSFAAWKVLRSLRPDVVVAESVKSLLFTWLPARLLRVPLVWSVHDRISGDYMARPYALLLRHLPRLIVAGFIVNSQTTRQTVRTRPHPVLVRPPGVDLQRVHNPHTNSSRETTVVMVGRLAPWKGQDVFLRAFAEVFRGSRASAYVVGGPLFGEDEFADSLKTLVKDLGCERQVTFTGHVQDPLRFFAAADVAVHASRTPEPFGAVVIEAMASGCAVIATSPGGPSEVITDGLDGLLVQCGDRAALVDALTRLRDDVTFRRSLAGRAVATAQAYDSDALAAAEVDWLESLISGARLPAQVSVPLRDGTPACSK